MCQPLLARPPAPLQGKLTTWTSMLVSGSSNAAYGAFLGLHSYLALDPKMRRCGAGGGREDRVSASPSPESVRPPPQRHSLPPGTAPAPPQGRRAAQPQHCGGRV